MSKPVTRGQERISKAEQRAWATTQKQESRARLKYHEESCVQIMVDLARYDLPLVQLLMAEFSLQPCNEGSAGQMRWHFLEQYGRTCYINGVTALSALPTAHRIKFNLARGSNVETVLTSQTVRRALTNSLASPLAALVQNYVSEAHWRKLILCFIEKVLYYFEPFGTRLRAGHAIIKAFDGELGVLNDGWVLKLIEVKVQTDGHSCGPWDLTVDRGFVAYVDSRDFGTGSFDVFLRTWLGQLQPQPVIDLFTVTNSGTQRIKAVEGNLAFIREERIRIRALLLAAARAGKLSNEGALLADFVEGRAAAATAELDLRDEQDEEEEG
eukprot:7377371-Prymnesium_polylepis.1